VNWKAAVAAELERGKKVTLALLYVPICLRHLRHEACSVMAHASPVLEKKISDPFQRSLVRMLLLYD